MNGGLNVDYIALNTTRPAFSNLTMRKAANFAVDRPALVRVRGFLAGKRSQQVLPPGIDGYKPITTYPIKGANYPKAKTLASSAGGCKDVTLYSGNTAVGQNLAQVFKYNLSQIGCNVNVKLFQGFQIYIAAGTKGEPFDAVFAGLVRRLRGSVRLHRHPPERSEHPRGEQQQPRLLQQREGRVSR